MEFVVARGYPGREMRILHVADLRLAAPPVPAVLAADAESALTAVGDLAREHAVDLLLLTGVFASVRPGARAQAHLGRTLRRLCGAGTAVVAVAGPADLPVGGGSGPFDVFAALAPRGAFFVQEPGVTAVSTGAGEVAVAVSVAVAGAAASGRRRHGASASRGDAAEVSELAAACAHAERSVLVLPGPLPDGLGGGVPFDYVGVAAADRPFLEPGPPPRAHPGPAYRRSFAHAEVAPVAALVDLDTGSVSLLGLPARPWVSLGFDVAVAVDAAGSVQAALSGADVAGAILRVELRGPAAALRAVHVGALKAAATTMGAVHVEVRSLAPPPPSVRAPAFADATDPITALGEYLRSSGVPRAEVATLVGLAAEVAEAVT